MQLDFLSADVSKSLSHCVVLGLGFTETQQEAPFPLPPRAGYELLNALLHSFCVNPQNGGLGIKSLGIRGLRAEGSYL